MCRLTWALCTAEALGEGLARELRDLININKHTQLYMCVYIYIYVNMQLTNAVYN